MVEEVTDCQHLGSVRRHIQYQSTVLWVAEACIGGHYEEQESSISSDRNQCWEDNVIPDSSEEHEFRDNSGHHTINIVIRPHGQTVSASWDLIYKVGESACERDVSPDCHCHT